MTTSNVKISGNQAKEFAELIVRDIAEFVSANRAAFEEFVQEEAAAEERGNL